MSVDTAELRPGHEAIVGIIKAGLPEKLQVANSERRVMMLRAIGGPDLSLHTQTLQAARDDFVAPLGTVERFLDTSIFRQGLTDFPDGFVWLEDPSPLGPTPEQSVAATDRGAALAGLGGHLLDLSAETGFALRTFLGKTLTPRTDLLQTSGDPAVSSQAGHLNLGALLAGRNTPITIDEAVSGSELGVTPKMARKQLKGWLDAGIVERERSKGGSYLWQFTGAGRMAFEKLITILVEQCEDPHATETQGRALLQSYYEDPDRRAMLPDLYRRDYIAAGSAEKGGIKKLFTDIKRAVQSLDRGSGITTSYLAELTGRPRILPRDLHRLEWLFGGDSPIRFEPNQDHRNTVWRVTG